MRTWAMVSRPSTGTPEDTQSKRESIDLLPIRHRHPLICQGALGTAAFELRLESKQAAEGDTRSNAAQRRPYHESVLRLRRAAVDTRLLRHSMPRLQRVKDSAQCTGTLTLLSHCFRTLAPSPCVTTHLHFFADAAARRQYGTWDASTWLSVHRRN